MSDPDKKGSKQLYDMGLAYIGAKFVHQPSRKKGKITNVHEVHPGQFSLTLKADDGSTHSGPLSDFEPN